jgi:signal transduction histidine kinase
MPVQLEEVDLREVMTSLLRSLAADLERAGCPVEVRSPAHVVGKWDRGRITEVLASLLYNAMKFGAGRPIEIAVDATPTHVTVRVRDHGMGISKEDQTRIFGRFERAVSTRHFGGFGLGLYVSAEILRAHHGALTVESEPGQGASFIMHLPREP